MYHASSHYRLPSHPSFYLLNHTMPKPMCDKIHQFWITSNDHFTKQIYLFSNQNIFGCYTSMIICIQSSCVFLWVANFGGPTSGFIRLPTLLRHFTAGIMSNHNWRVFHPRGCLSLLANTRLIFYLPHYSIVRLYWTSSHLTEPTQSNTKRSVDSSTIHSHPFNVMSPCICNAMRHCMLYHATCIMNAIWTKQSTPLTRCHGQSHHLHMTSIYHFIQVNIS